MLNKGNPFFYKRTGSKKSLKKEDSRSNMSNINSIAVDSIVAVEVNIKQKKAFDGDVAG